MDRRIAFALLPLVAACAGTGGSFPSLLPRPAEIPRDIVAPGADTVPALSPEQQESLRADLARERTRLDEIEADLAEAGAALDRAMAGARGSRPGAESWSNAQMALSRFDIARGPLASIGQRLAALARTVDSLPETNQDRNALQTLAARTAAAADTAQRRVDAATGDLRP